MRRVCVCVCLCVSVCLCVCGGQVDRARLNASARLYTVDVVLVA